uniref:C-type lectin domain-containing protein n=1 Tax=Astyanax mexicanus TaxID=7994 RepID=A0A3B1KGF6_ASTMX
MASSVDLFGRYTNSVCGVSPYVPHRYHFVNKNWTEAQSYCRQTYTDLATINNMNEMKKLKNTLKNKDGNYVWIGLNRGNTGKWGWSLGGGNLKNVGVSYRNWSSGEPNNARAGNEFCVAMFNTNGKWLDVQCGDYCPFVNTERYIFINETMTWRKAQSYCRENHTDLASVRNETERQQICSVIQTADRNWIGLFNDSWNWSDQSSSSFHKLILIQQKLSWPEALRYCRENHVDLVSVHSEEIQLWVEDVVQKASTDHVWLGLRHTCTLRFWFWMSGDFICYDNWAPGNGTEGEDCSPVERTGAVQARGDQQWVSLPENQTLNFICIKYEG